MNILVIGPTAESCHVGENLYKSLQKKQHNVVFCGKQQIEKIPEFRNIIRKALNHEVVLKLSKVVDNLYNDYDFVFIDEGYFLWENDIDVPVIYYQREFYRMPRVFYPTIALFFHSAIITYFWTFVKHWMHRIKNVYVFPIAVDFETYQPMKKEFDGVSAIGFREPFKDIDEMPELTKLSAYTMLDSRFEEFKKTGLKYFDTPISNQRYRYLLPRCAANWIPISPFQYTTRRIVETMACKTACVIKTEGPRHTRILQELGYEEWKHYVPIDEISQCLNVHRHFRREPETCLKMANKAFLVTQQRHSYDKRAEFLVKLIKQKPKGIFPL